MNKKLEGEGFKEVITGAVDRVTGFFKGQRLDFPPNERALLKLYGNETIIEMTLFRAPIHSMIDKVLNVISIGAWDVLKSENNFDKMFHLYMVLKLSNNRMIRLEKNHVVNISASFKVESDAEYQIVPLQGRRILLNELLNNAIVAVGKKQFFIYSPWSTNCQRFLLDVLQSNNLLTQQAQTFIYQDITNIVKNLPWYTKLIGQTTTDLAHKADIILHGQGLKKINK